MTAGCLGELVESRAKNYEDKQDSQDEYEEEYADGLVEWIQWIRHYLQIVQKKGMKGAETEAEANPSLPRWYNLSIVECLHDVEAVLVSLGEERVAALEAAMDFAGPLLGEAGMAGLTVAKYMCGNCFCVPKNWWG